LVTKTINCAACGQASGDDVWRSCEDCGAEPLCERCFSAHVRQAEAARSDGYHYAGWARDQIATATELADQSGNGNDAVLQASVAAASSRPSTPGSIVLRSASIIP